MYEFVPIQAWTTNFQIICIQRTITIMILANWHEDPNYGVQNKKSVLSTVIFSITDLSAFILALSNFFSEKKENSVLCKSKPGITCSLHYDIY